MKNNTNTKKVVPYVFCFLVVLVSINYLNVDHKIKQAFAPLQTFRVRSEQSSYLKSEVDSWVVLVGLHLLSDMIWNKLGKWAHIILITLMHCRLLQQFIRCVWMHL